RGGPDREDPGTLHPVAGELSAAALPLERARRGASGNPTAWLLIAPACLALLLLFVVPIAYVLLLSVTDPRLSIAHYQRIFTVPVYTRVMVNTFVTSLIVTALCLLIGYPIAYVMARRPGWVSTLLLTVVALASWSSPTHGSSSSAARGRWRPPTERSGSARRRSSSSPRSARRLG